MLKARFALILGISCISIIGIAIGVAIGKYAFSTDNSSISTVPAGSSNKLIDEDSLPQNGFVDSQKKHSALYHPWHHHEQITAATPLSEENVTQAILNGIDPKHISAYLAVLASVPHIAGSPQDLEQAEWVRDHYIKCGFDRVVISSYYVLLSYPDADNPNEVNLLNSNDDVEYASHGREPPLHSPAESSPLVLPTFNAYSGTGNVTGDAVYVYYGRDEDYTYLEEKNVDVAGKIVIARYGVTFRGNIAKSAIDRGAIGVILFSDPIDFAPLGPEFTYPNSVFLPELGVQDGTLMIENGDPLTPFYPSVDSAYYIQENETDLPTIPVQPIGYEDAQAILQAMDESNPSPAHWHGLLNTSYPLGPGFKNNWKLQMNVRTSNQMATINNVIAVINGELEPDRSVVLGNHRDAWILGAIDPNSGTAALMELGRVLGGLKETYNWRPRRNLVFCSWGAEEYGLVGSTEWTEEYKKLLQYQGVAYLNVDVAVSGNRTFSGSGVPLLYETLRNATKIVPNPNSDEVALGRETVYDSWLAYTPDKLSNGTEPGIHDLGSGSDFTGFIHTLGISSLDFSFVDNGTSSYPLYHTLYETHYLASYLLGGFEYQAAIAKVWGEIARNIADSPILPMKVVDYGNYLVGAVDEIKKRDGWKFTSQNISLEYFELAANNFLATAKTLQQEIDGISPQDLMSVRRVNDQLMNVERSFINQWGLPGRSYYNHVVFAPSAKNTYKSSSFSSLTDLLSGINLLPEPQRAAQWESIKQQLSQITYYINSATKVMIGKF